MAKHIGYILYWFIENVTGCLRLLSSEWCQRCIHSKHEYEDKMKYSREARLWSPKEAHWCRYLPTGQQVAKPSENISQTNKSLLGRRQAADEKSKKICPRVRSTFYPPTSTCFPGGAEIRLRMNGEHPKPCRIQTFLRSSTTQSTVGWQC